MGWRESLIRTIGPGLAVGMTFGDWMRLLAANGFRVRPRCWAKAACATLFSLIHTTLSCLEHVLFDRRIAAEPIPPPLFVLGHWRNGTTHLHNLLAVDRRFAYPKVYQVVAPHTFLLGEPVFAAIGSFFLPRTRLGVDNMALNAEVPAEDEIALCVTTLLSPILGFAFPQRAQFYDRYFTFRGVAREELEQWKSAFIAFAKKLTWKYKRPLILKSPSHTCRIKLILDTFPDARFVHIHRNPYVVYQSMMRLMPAAWEIYSFQYPDSRRLHGRVIRQYKAMYDAFFEERRLIPAGRYCEVAFEELEGDPLGQMRKIYEEVSLSDFAVVRPALEEYVRSLAGYKKNTYPELPAGVRSEIARAWRRCFDEWKYPIEDCE